MAVNSTCKKPEFLSEFDVPEEKLVSVRKWVNSGFGGRFIGGELAKRGYVCMAVVLPIFNHTAGEEK